MTNAINPQTALMMLPPPVSVGLSLFLFTPFLLSTFLSFQAGQWNSTFLLLQISAFGSHTTLPSSSPRKFTLSPIIYNHVPIFLVTISSSSSLVKCMQQHDCEIPIGTVWVRMYIYIYVYCSFTFLIGNFLTLTDRKWLLIHIHNQYFLYNYFFKDIAPILDKACL